MEGTAMFAPLTEDEKATASRPKPEPAWRPLIPVPADAKPMNFEIKDLGPPDMKWAYGDAAAKLVCYICRWNITGNDGKPDKVILPVTFCVHDDGRRAWRSKGVPKFRPLYKLSEIIKRKSTTVLVCEGEKTADAAATLFPDMVTTTPMHGSKSPHLTDFTPLAGRTVIIVTDNDKAGVDFGRQVCQLVRDAGATKVLHLKPGVFGDNLPVGWDLADALAAGWTADKVAALGDIFTEFETSATQEEVSSWPFRLTAAGVEKRIDKTDPDTGKVTHEWRWICSTLEVVAETRSSDGEEWGRLLRIKDRDNKVKEWSMPMSMLAGDGTAYRERLLSLGLIMAPGKSAKEALHEMIATARPQVKARCVGRVGWHSKSFILSSETVEH